MMHWHLVMAMTVSMSHCCRRHWVLLMVKSRWPNSILATYTGVSTAASVRGSRRGKSIFSLRTVRHRSRIIPSALR